MLRILNSMRCINILIIKLASSKKYLLISLKDMYQGIFHLIKNKAICTRHTSFYHYRCIKDTVKHYSKISNYFLLNIDLVGNFQDIIHSKANTNLYTTCTIMDLCYYTISIFLHPHKDHN